MKVLKVTASNFASYKDLEFNMDSQGLALIHGATGSGKSTIQDLVCWALFGKTAKGGTVDEVRSWHDDAPTQVTVELKPTLFVTRVRGTAQQNDLYFGKTIEEKTRGKDITETQELLNAALGFDFDLYFTAAYFSEFSPTATFFTASAKQKREIFEKVANLSVPEFLLTQVAEKKKEANTKLKAATNTFAIEQGKLAQAELMETKRKAQFIDWEKRRDQELVVLQHQNDNFEQNKASRIAALVTKKEANDLFLNNKKKQIYDSLQKRELVLLSEQAIADLIQEQEALNLSKECQHCGGLSKKVATRLKEIDKALAKHSDNVKEINHLKLELQNINNRADEFIPLITSVQNEANPHAAELKKLKEAKNPYAEMPDLDILRKSVDKCDNIVKDLNNQINTYEQLTDVFNKMRSTLLLNSLQDIEFKTNEKLSKYFDSPFHVQLRISSSDKLLTSIQKEGVECSYTQLSKGQRGLLKLCFMTSVMEAASNRAGIHFDTLFFDEALDGLDELLKEKAFGMLEHMSLNHSSIFFIEHSEAFKNLFDNKYHVTNDGEWSSIEQS